MTDLLETPTLYVGRALRRHFVFWFISGVFLGLAHLAQWSPNHPKTFAFLLWLDEAPMATLFFLTIILMLSGALLYRFRKRAFHQTLSARIEPAIRLLTQLASITVQVTLGMGVVALFSGAAAHALLIVLFVVYIIAMMEISTGLWRPAGLSKASPHLLAILMAAPLVARFL